MALGCMLHYVHKLTTDYLEDFGGLGMLQFTGRESSTMPPTDHYYVVVFANGGA